MADKRSNDEKAPEQFKGWLLKWTNYIKGYQKRWFVLSSGLLSYYRTQEEMAHTCRGTINLAGAVIDTVDSTHFVITNGPTQVFHLRALNEVERQRWVTALELAKGTAIRRLDDDSDSDEEATENSGETTPLSQVMDKVKELSMAHELLKEKLVMFKLTAGAMVKASQEFAELAKDAEHRWSRSLQQEHALRLQLQESLEMLANQMHGLENQAKRATWTPAKSAVDIDRKLGVSASEPDLKRKGGAEGGTKEEEEEEEVKAGEEEEVDTHSELREEEEEDKFYDAPEADDSMVASASERTHARNQSAGSMNDMETIADIQAMGPEGVMMPFSARNVMMVPTRAAPSFFEHVECTLPTRRINIPPRPNKGINLWSLMKNCIGKDLSKIPLPVNVNEPLSFIQRLTEELLYAKVLEKAAACEDPLEQMAYVSGFASSVYASTIHRVGKPFNPLLGETFECDRRAEHGWRCFLEQVGHHPPMCAMYVEHKDWTYWQEYSVASKFRGKYLLVYPIGATHLVFHRTGHHYTWTKVVVTVHNIIVGKLWVDQSGDMKIVNHTTKDECHLKFQAYSYFSRERQRKISGTITNAAGCPVYVVNGYWDDYLEAAKITHGDEKNPVTEPAMQVWKATPPDPGHELIYGFSQFSCTLNEMEAGIAPTDSRFRPDQRLMEQGDYDGANAEKVRLEEKQRSKRRKREALAAEAAEAAAAGNLEEAKRLQEEAASSPLWFKKECDPLTGTMLHVYQGGYWEAKMKGDWGREMPDIF
ncbi:hypothetical protein EMCRGX_G025043 [Ephydatia muelleri]